MTSQTGTAQQPYMTAQATHTHGHALSLTQTHTAGEGYRHSSKAQMESFR